MKVLVLGANGMLGHKLCQVLADRFEVVATIRGGSAEIRSFRFFNGVQIKEGLDAVRIDLLEKVMSETAPDAVVNCVGIVKQLKAANDRLASIRVNALFPHELHEICRRRHVRLVHLSTDCVFSGHKGRYREDDYADASDVYGRTKYLGEVSANGALTIRTSIIGRQLSASNGLVEWFLSNRGGRVSGFSRAIFSGFPTLHLSRILADVLDNQRNLEGLFHVSADPISKYELLGLIRDRMQLNIEIEESRSEESDRSLDSTLFRSLTGFRPLPWDVMIDQFAEDARQYHWRD